MNQPGLGSRSDNGQSDLSAVFDANKPLIEHVSGRPVTPRMLRYSFAFSLLDQQYDKALIQQVMGFSSSEPVQRIKRAWQYENRECLLPISPLDREPNELVTADREKVAANSTILKHKTPN